MVDRLTLACTMFHENAGANVSLSSNGTTALWHPMTTGGCAFPRLPLSASQPITLLLDGSGATELSVMPRNPTIFADDPPNSSAHIRGCIFLNDVKLHKRKCNMKISIDSSGTEVTSTCGGGQYVQEVQGGRTYWLVVDIKYGKVEVKIENQENENNRNEFLRIHGNNMLVMNDPSVVHNIHRSPASVCILNSPLRAGKRLTIRCICRPYHGTVPGRHSVTARISKDDPVKFKSCFPAEFDVTVKDDKVPELIEVECFEKDECTGDLILDVYKNRIAYTSATGKTNKHPYPIKSTGPTWLLLWLYGVSVTVECTDIPDIRRPNKATETEKETKNADRNDDLDYLQVSSIEHRPVNMALGVDRPNEAIRESVEEMTHAMGRLVDRLDSVENGEELATLRNVNPCMLPTRPLPPIPVQTGKTTKPKSAVKYEKPNPDPEENMVTLERAIKHNFVDLVQSLELRELLDYLYQAEVITIAELGRISKTLETDATRAIRDTLMLLSSRPVRKKVFINALEKTGQGFLVPKFFPRR